MKPSLKLENLYVNYDEDAVLWDVSCEIPSGVLVGIIGPNGAGKSTLLKTALGLVKPLSGQIDLFSSPLHEIRSKIAYVPQREVVDWDFPITAIEVVLMGRYGKLGWFGKLRKADKEAALYALDLVGMVSYAGRQIGELSGGQQQRLFIARALVQNPDLFLLDEPFAGVDIATERAIIALLKTLRDQGKTIIVVHHDLPTVEEYFDWTIILNRRLIACGPVSEVYHKEHLIEAFGKAAPLFEEAAKLSAKSRAGL